MQIARMGVVCPHSSRQVDLVESIRAWMSSSSSSSSLIQFVCAPKDRGIMWASTFECVLVTCASRHATVTARSPDQSRIISKLLNNHI